MRLFCALFVCLFISACSQTTGCNPLWHVEDCNTSGNYVHNGQKSPPSPSSSKEDDYSAYSPPPLKPPPKVWGNQ